MTVSPDDQRPDRVPLLYIDLNYWIQLTRARLNRPGTKQHGDVLHALAVAVDEGRVVTPLSTTHYMELSRVKSPQQRSDVAITMGQLSRFTALTCRETFLAHDLRVVLAGAVDGSYSVRAPSPVGYGFAHAFGKPEMVGRLRAPASLLTTLAEQSGPDIEARLVQYVGHGWELPAARSNEGALDRLQRTVDVATQHLMLRGPADSDIPSLLQHGYNPTAAYEVTERIRRREEDLASTLAAEPAWLKRLDDVLDARALYWDVNEYWSRALRDVGRPKVQIEHLGRKRIHEILTDIRIIAIESAVRRRRFRNRSYRWDMNDIYDLSFVGQAVGYCDAVLTERDLRAHIVHERLDQRYRTAALRDLTALGQWLDELGPRRATDD